MQGTINSWANGLNLQIQIKCTFPLNYPNVCPYIAIMPPSGYQLNKVPFLDGYQVITNSIKSWSFRQDSTAIVDVFSDIISTFNNTLPVVPMGGMQIYNYTQNIPIPNQYNSSYNNYYGNNPSNNMVDDSALRTRVCQICYYKLVLTAANSQQSKLSNMVDELSNLETQFIQEEGKLKNLNDQLSEINTKIDTKIQTKKSIAKSESKVNKGITKQNVYQELGPSDENRNLLFSIIAKIKAIDDALYILRKSYEEKAISLHELLEGIKIASRKQFYSKYKCQKIISQNLIKPK